MSDLEELKSRLDAIEKEKRAIEADLRSLQNASSQAEPAGTIISGTIPKTPEEKIALFMKLFACRTDVFPHRWESQNKSGYSPACRNEWKRPLCRKPEVKCTACTNKDFIPLTDDVVRAHLEGRSTIGTYAIREDDTCIFLAADFDESEWMQDVHAYKEAAGKLGVDVAVERSRSGNGAHAWIFFNVPVPARDARMLGTILLSKASYLRHEIGLDSYDRFFPSQDTIPKGNFGNLIALPLQKNPRRNGNSEFIDDTGVSYADQWEYLSQRRALNPAELKGAISENTEPPLLGRPYPFETEDITAAEQGVSIPPKPLEGILSGTVSLIIDADIRIDTRDLPPQAVTAMKRLATFANPKFYELERMRFPTYNTPRYISSARIYGALLSLPRGLLDDLVRLIRDAGADAAIDDRRVTASPIELTCKTILTDQQRSAVDSILEYDDGVLVAPTGSGKTVMGIAIIAARKQPTLILVNRKELMEQWRDRIMEYTNIPKTGIGMIGAGKKKTHGIIDIAMLQTLSRQETLADISANYGQVIIDEAHHIPAFSFEQVLNKFSARHVLGLTATPYRKDGHQKIMYMQCGPIRHEMKADERSTVNRILVARPVAVLEATDPYGRKRASYC
ncbi:MAG: DEAD/DEAH box helicase family protein [Spirochaetes bacterium]|nr:DEAD/DEAH box helicase family protein [Spirochaetota bacterium]